jgi:hypothetical protein
MTGTILGEMQRVVQSPTPSAVDLSSLAQEQMETSDAEEVVTETEQEDVPENQLKRRASVSSAKKSKRSKPNGALQAQDMAPSTPSHARLMDKLSDLNKTSQKRIEKAITDPQFLTAASDLVSLLLKESTEQGRTLEDVAKEFGMSVKENGSFLSKLKELAQDKSNNLIISKKYTEYVFEETRKTLMDQFKQQGKTAFVQLAKELDCEELVPDSDEALDALLKSLDAADKKTLDLKYPVDYGLTMYAQNGVSQGIRLAAHLCAGTKKTPLYVLDNTSFLSAFRANDPKTLQITHGIDQFSMFKRPSVGILLPKKRVLYKLSDKDPLNLFKLIVESLIKSQKNNALADEELGVYAKWLSAYKSDKRSAPAKKLLPGEKTPEKSYPLDFITSRVDYEQSVLAAMKLATQPLASFFNDPSILFINSMSVFEMADIQDSENQPPNQEKQINVGYSHLPWNYERMINLAPACELPEPAKLYLKVSTALPDKPALSMEVPPLTPVNEFWSQFHKAIVRLNELEDDPASKRHFHALCQFVSKKDGLPQLSVPLYAELKTLLKPFLYWSSQSISSQKLSFRHLFVKRAKKAPVVDEHSAAEESTPPPRKAPAKTKKPAEPKPKKTIAKAKKVTKKPEGKKTAKKTPGADHRSASAKPAKPAKTSKKKAARHEPSDDDTSDLPPARAAVHEDNDEDDFQEDEFYRELDELDDNELDEELDRYD